MSFISKLFADNITPVEKENRAILEAMVKERKTALKAECSLLEMEYKNAVKEAEREYQRAIEQAKANVLHQVFSALERDVDFVLASDAYSSADAKTKAKIDSFKHCMTSAAFKHLSADEETFKNEKASLIH
ncbi:hypothetical protein BGZ94_002926 [Podila epigama]|nr:hypothetical protein BGZ94_002926 [Podila epigama]